MVGMPPGASRMQTAFPLISVPLLPQCLIRHGAGRLPGRGERDQPVRLAACAADGCRDRHRHFQRRLAERDPHRCHARHDRHQGRRVTDRPDVHGHAEAVVLARDRSDEQLLERECQLRARLLVRGARQPGLRVPRCDWPWRPGVVVGQQPERVQRSGIRGVLSRARRSPDPTPRYLQRSRSVDGGCEGPPRHPVCAVEAPWRPDRPAEGRVLVPRVPSVDTQRVGPAGAVISASLVGR